jgi:hypothetical protein
MTPEEQVLFARRRCEELAATRLATHHVRRSLIADGLDRAIVDEAIAEYEVLLAKKSASDRIWWRVGAFIVFGACVGYVLFSMFGKPNIIVFHSYQGIALGVGLIALLQALMPMIPRSR